jgi:hypothetical protein
MELAPRVATNVSKCGAPLPRGIEHHINGADSESKFDADTQALLDRTAGFPARRELAG